MAEPTIASRDKALLAAAAAAMKAAERLDAVGEHKLANDVRRVCHGYRGCRTMMQALHRDNMALREALAALKATHWYRGFSKGLKWLQMVAQ